MLMPYSSAFTVNNIGIDIVHLPTIYLVSGLFSIVTGPLVGRASDAFGKYPTFVFGCAMTVIMVLIYTHLGHVSLVTAIIVNVLMFVGIFSRMIPSQALISAIPTRASAARSARSAPRSSSSPAGSARCLRLRSSRNNLMVRCCISSGSAMSSSRRRSSRWSRCILCRSLGGGAGGEERGLSGITHW